MRERDCCMLTQIIWSGELKHLAEQVGESLKKSIRNAPLNC